MRRLVFTAIMLSLLVGAAAADPRQDVRIATFNIQVFGPAKVNRTAIRAYLAEVVRKFDIVAIQEVKDASQAVPDAFLAEINKGGRRYLYVLSERTAVVRWTNLYDKAWWVLNGDVIGGPLSENFGPGITDVDLAAIDRPSWGFSHTRYWDLRQPPARLLWVRKAVNLLDL